MSVKSNRCACGSIYSAGAFGFGKTRTVETKCCHSCGSHTRETRSSTGMFLRWENLALKDPASMPKQPTVANLIALAQTMFSA